jgi:hypothetical protein
MIPFLWSWSGRQFSLERLEDIACCGGACSLPAGLVGLVIGFVWFRAPTQSRGAQIGNAILVGALIGAINSGVIIGIYAYLMKTRM